jgi:Na+-translocating ferredoxin:NAD+ oxidoreductase subunit G
MSAMPTNGQSGGPAGVSSGRMVLVMGTVGLIASILLVGTYQITLPYIEANRTAFLEAAIFDVLPGATAKTTFVRDGKSLVPLTDESRGGLRVHAGYDEAGRLVGIAVPAQGPGFVDVIRILYGYDHECECVVGMRVLESRETPGLGDKVETDPNYVGAFKELDVRLDATGAQLRNPVTAVKPGARTDAWQVETITGATVTARAIIDIVHASTAEVLPLIRANLGVLRERVADEHYLEDPAVTPLPRPSLPPVTPEGGPRNQPQP